MFATYEAENNKKTVLKPIGSQWLKCQKCCVRFSIMFPIGEDYKVRYCPNCGAEVIDADMEPKIGGLK